MLNDLVVQQFSLNNTTPVISQVKNSYVKPMIRDHPFLFLLICVFVMSLVQHSYVFGSQPNKQPEKEEEPTKCTQTTV